MSGNHRFRKPVIEVVTPHNCAYLLHQASYFYATKVLSIECKDFYCCPLGPIMSKIINAPATKLHILAGFRYAMFNSEKQLIKTLKLRLRIQNYTYRMSKKICYNPGNSTLLFCRLVLLFQVSDKTRNKFSKDSFIQIYD